MIYGRSHYRKMRYTMGTNRTEYQLEYAKKNLKRIPLDVQKEKYEEIKAAAEATGESVNGYIKTAVDRRIESGD